MFKPDIKKWMDRKCLCGCVRGAHAHGHAVGTDGEWSLCSVPCMNCACTCFVDEFERELGGCPMENEHLSPLMRGPVDSEAN